MSNGGAGSFEYEFLDKFISETKRANWQDQFDNIQQGRMTIEQYNDEFMRLIEKVDPNIRLPNGHVLRKYVKGLDPKYATLVYASDPTNLDAAMEAATKLATGHEMVEQHKRKVNMTEQLEDMELRINILKKAQETDETLEIVPKPKEKQPQQQQIVYQQPPPVYQV